MKPASKLIMPVRGCPLDAEIPVAWQLVNEFPVLGHIVAANGSCHPCFRNTQRSIWKAYFGNVAADAMRGSPVGLRLRLLDRVCKAPLAYRCSRWPPNKTLSLAVDRFQTKLVASTLRTQRLPGETAPDYVQRRNASAARTARHCGKWSSFWYARVLAWDAHIQRRHFPMQWSFDLLKFRGAQWLESRRQLDSLRRPGCRKFAGQPTPRWHEGKAFADARQT